MKRMFLVISILLNVISCTSTLQEEKQIKNLTEDQKQYWYNNEAEITSYQLIQARYGELREGNAVLVFVTEPFSIKSNTKADNPTQEDVSVLKLNYTKKFNTGIYPYSMMNSTFFPFKNGKHSLKVSSSSQEWCGHTYMELVNKDKFEVKINSYFEGESAELNLDKTMLEDDIYSMIRLQPKDLPVGKQKVIPSFFYLRLLHKELKAYECNISHSKENDSLLKITLTYPELERSLSISYQANFPYKIMGWQEEYYSGWGESRKKLTTKATLLKTIKIDYWNKNSNADAYLRDSLQLR